MAYYAGTWAGLGVQWEELGVLRAGLDVLEGESVASLVIVEMLHNRVEKMYASSDVVVVVVVVVVFAT